MPEGPADNPSPQGPPVRADDFAEALRGLSHGVGGAPLQSLPPPKVIGSPPPPPDPVPSLADPAPDGEPAAPEPPDAGAADLGAVDDLVARVIDEVGGLGRKAAASSRPAAIGPPDREQLDLLRQVLGEVDELDGGPDLSLIPPAGEGAGRGALAQLISEVDNLSESSPPPIEPGPRRAMERHPPPPAAFGTAVSGEAPPDEVDLDEDDELAEEELDLDSPDAVDVATLEQDLPRGEATAGAISRTEADVDLPIDPGAAVNPEEQSPAGPAATDADRPAFPGREAADGPDTGPANVAPSGPGGSTASAPPPPEPASASTDAVDLAEIDQAIADDIDGLVPGGYESVDDVLQGVFEEVATLVQEAENAPAVVHPAAETKPADPGETPPAAAPAPSEAATPKPAKTDRGPAPPADAPPAPTDRIVELKRKVRSVWSAVEPTVVVVLKGANYPLRFLPDPVRQIVDWIALTLVFWVPITWVIALLVIG